MARPVASRAVRRFIERWELRFAVATAVLYASTIPLLIAAFPNVSNLWVSIFVLVGGFTSSMSALASLLKERDPS